MHRLIYLIILQGISGDDHYCGFFLDKTASNLECLGNLSEVTKSESGKTSIRAQKFWPLRSPLLPGPFILQV